MNLQSLLHQFLTFPSRLIVDHFYLGEIDLEEAHLNSLQGVEQILRIFFRHDFLVVFLSLLSQSSIFLDGVIFF